MRELGGEAALASRERTEFTGTTRGDIIVFSLRGLPAEAAEIFRDYGEGQTILPVHQTTDATQRTT